MKRRFLVFAPLITVLFGITGCGGSGDQFIATTLPKTSVPSISFSSTTAQTFTVSEPGYSGKFTAVSSDITVVTVAAATSSSTSTSQKHRDTTDSATSSGSFTVTPVGGGTAMVTVSDNNGNSTSIPVSVSSATLVTQLQH